MCLTHQSWCVLTTYPSVPVPLTLVGPTYLYISFLKNYLNQINLDIQTTRRFQTILSCTKLRRDTQGISTRQQTGWDLDGQFGRHVSDDLVIRQLLFRRLVVNEINTHRFIGACNLQVPPTDNDTKTRRDSTIF